ncbi:MAG: 6-phosphofructokinase [Mycoplasmoidaceae bacterium]|nr:6-phosphofructokinase [Mycoplasmoidaceae bacterium]
MGQNKKKRYAILCSGGSAPGMATCVISFVKKCLSCGVEPVAIYDGYEGLHNDKFKTLSNNIVFNYIDNGSALIGTSRCPKFKEDSEYRKKCAQNIFKNKIDGLVVVGGEGSYKGALELSRLGVNVMTIPATIDNDVPSSTYTIGFDTCLNTVCREVGDVNDVFASHKGVGIIEVMGRGCPDVTIRSAIACNATYMVTKFSKLKPDGFLKIVQDGFARGKSNVTFIVTEQLYPESGKNSLSSIAK